jgi:hypothetical protein
MKDDDECGAVGGMRIGMGNRSTRKKFAPVPFCPPQIPHDLTWDRVGSCGICGGQGGTGTGLLRVLRFPVPIFIPPIAPQSPPYITWGWYNRPVVAAVPSGLSLTPLRIIKKKTA